jgi:hypothetical protein
VTLPSLSEASALRVNVAGAMSPDPSLGVVIDTSGNALTMRVTLLLDWPPTLSVSTAHRMYVPADRLVTVMRKGLLVSMPNELVPFRNST